MSQSFFIFAFALVLLSLIFLKIGESSDSEVWNVAGVILSIALTTFMLLLMSWMVLQ